MTKTSRKLLLPVAWVVSLGVLLQDWAVWSYERAAGSPNGLEALPLGWVGVLLAVMAGALLLSTSVIMVRLRLLRFMTKRAKQTAKREENQAVGAVLPVLWLVALIGVWQCVALGTVTAESSTYALADRALSVPEIVLGVACALLAVLVPVLMVMRTREAKAAAQEQAAAAAAPEPAATR